MKNRQRALLSVLIALVVACALAGSGAPWAGDLAEVSGKVLDSQTHAIAGAQVTLSGVGWAPVTLETSAHGDFRFWGVRTNKGYRIGAKKDGFREIEYDGLYIGPGEKRLVQFRLKKVGEREAVALVTRDPIPEAGLVRSFLEGLGVETRTIDLDAERDPAETVRRVAAEKPDLILATGLRAAQLVRSEVRDVPSIVTLIGDPRTYDLRAPNICFLENNPAPSAVIERVVTLLPKVHRLGLVFSADSSGLLARDLREEAGRRGLEVELFGWFEARHAIRNLDLAPEPFDALLVLFDPLSTAPGALETLTSWSLRHKVPLVAPQADWMRRGALFSFGASLDQMGAQARSMGRQILFEGRQPEDFGVRYAAEPILSINRGTATALGIALPDSADLAPSEPPSHAR